MAIEKPLFPSIDHKKIAEEEQAIYLPAFYYAETGTAGRLKRLLEAPAEDPLWKSLMAAREKTGNQELSIDVRKIEQKLQMEYS